MRKATKILSLLVAFAMLASLFVGCGDGNAADSAVNIGVTDTLSSANPLLLDQSELAKIVCDLQYSQLCELDSELNFVPMLASSITTEDNIHFTVKLDENAKWSDGEAITADDVVFTVLKFASPTIANATMLLYAFEGTDDETGFTAAGATAEDLPGCKAVDEHTVEFTAKYEMPLTSFQNTYGRYLHILPKHMLEGMTDDELLTTAYFDTAEVVSGPYRLTSYDNNHYITFVANDKYWKGAPKIENLNIIIEDASQLYAALKSDEIDLVQQTTASVPYDDYKNISELENVTVHMGSMVTNQSLFIQTKNITDVRIRKAILMGMDRNTMLTQFLNGNGEIVDGFLSSASPFYDSSLTPTAFDQAAAKALVDEAAADGYDVSKPINFYVNSGDATMVNVASYISSEMTEIGLTLSIHTVDFSTLMSVAGTDEVDMFAVQYSYCPVDPYPDVAWLLGGEESWTGYANDEIDAALAASQATSNVDETRGYYLTVDQIVQEDVPMASIYIISALGATNNRLKNATPNVYGTFANVNEWEIAE